MKNKFLVRGFGSGGFSIVEMLVAVTIGLVVLIGVSYAYLGNRQTYVLNEEMARMQESARVASETLGHDLRMQNGFGCKRAQELDKTPTFLKALGDDAAVKDFADTLNGNGGQAGLMASGVGSTTKLIAYTLSGPGVAQVNGAEATGSTITVNGGVTAHRLAANAQQGGSLSRPYLVVSDCDKAVVFKATSIAIPESDSGTGEIGLPAALTHVFTRGAEVSGFVAREGSTTLARTYEVKDSSRKDLQGVPILSLFADGDELIEGVEAFRVCVGGKDLDKGASTSGLLNLAAVTDKKQLAKIEQVQVDLVLHSIRPRVLPEKLAQTFELCDGKAYTPDADMRLRRLFSSSFSLKNRIGRIDDLKDE